jgi:DNA-binding HxlR family transcriptional regulator
LTLIFGKWVAPILAALHGGPVRRTTLRGRRDGVSDKILTATLRRVERGGLMTRITIPSVPIEIDYGLTAYACLLWPVLQDLEAWAGGLDRHAGTGVSPLGETSIDHTPVSRIGR